MPERLASAQRGLYADALAYREANTHEITSFDAFASGLEEQGGFWRGAWCGEGSCEAEITAQTKATIRFLPIEPTDPGAAACTAAARASTSPPGHGRTDRWRCVHPARIRAAASR